MTENQRLRFADALKRVSNDEATLEMLAKITQEDAPKLLDSFVLAVEEEDYSRAATTAHTLKGMLSAFETNQPVRQLETAIEAARRSKTQDLKRVTDSSVPEIRGLIGEISQLAGNG